MKRKKNQLTLANRYKNKLCDACYLGYGIIWDGIDFKLDKCLFCSNPLTNDK